MSCIYLQPINNATVSSEKLENFSHGIKKGGLEHTEVKVLPTLRDMWKALPRTGLKLQKVNELNDVLVLIHFNGQGAVVCNEDNHEIVHLPNDGKLYQQIGLFLAKM